MAGQFDPVLKPEQALWNHQLDTSVSPPAVVIGLKAKDATGGYTPLDSTSVGGKQSLNVTLGSSGASSGQVDAHPVTSAGVSLVDTQGGQTYQKVGIVADQDKFVKGTVAPDASAATVEPVLTGGYASAAAPTSVSADGDAVNSWHLRNGAQATVLTAGGALIGGNATTGLDVRATGFVSPDETGNSSKVALGISGVFTGTGEDVSAYSAITLSIKSNRASATSGVAIQFSSDNSNWSDLDFPTLTYVAGADFSITFRPRGRYYRVTYTNSALAQSSFRMQSVYRTAAPSLHQIPGTWSIGINSNNNDPSPNVAQTVNSQNHQIWSPEHPQNDTGATGEFYPQNQSDTGELHASISTIRGIQMVELGHGTTAAVAKTYPTNQPGTMRVAQAGSATSTTTTVAASASAVQILAANTARSEINLYNDSPEWLYIRYSTTNVTTTTFDEIIEPYSEYYTTTKTPTAKMTGLWTGATGNARVTERT